MPRIIKRNPEQTREDALRVPLENEIDRKEQEREEERRDEKEEKRERREGDRAKSHKIEDPTEQQIEDRARYRDDLYNLATRHSLVYVGDVLRWGFELMSEIGAGLVSEVIMMREMMEKMVKKMEGEDKERDDGKKR